MQDHTPQRVERMVGRDSYLGNITVEEQHLRCCLGNRLYLYLCDTDGSCSHADPQSVNSSVDEVLSLLCSHYVAPYDLQVRVVLLDVLDHVDLKDRVALGGVRPVGRGRG